MKSLPPPTARIPGETTPGETPCRASGIPRRSPALRRGLLALAVLLAAAHAPAPVADADAEPARAEMQSLDEQVQEIKTEALSIAAELRQLEEKLLFPSNTQVSVFVGFEEDERLRLDAVEIRLDGEPVAYHVYSFEELEALQKGGVQRVYTGNVSAGAHTLEVIVRGELPGGGAFLARRSHEFRKEVEPALLGVTLLGSGSGPERIELGAL